MRYCILDFVLINLVRKLVSPFDYSENYQDVFAYYYLPSVIILPIVVKGFNKKVKLGIVESRISILKRSIL